jgi:amino acid adenylation domain-containing protein
VSPSTAPTPTAAAASGEYSLADAFRAQARRLPDHPAVRDGDRVFSYREIDEASDAIAAAVAARSGVVGGLIGLVVDRSAATPVRLLGVLKAGLAYVPLDPSYPRDRLRYIVEDSGIEIVLGDEEAAQACGLGHLTVLDQGGGSDGPPPSVPISSQDPAYVIYTSGSTGRPKGCVVTHGNVLALMRHALPLFDVGEDDRWTLFHSMSFDFSVWELWGALLSGGTAVCVPAAVSRAAEEMLELLARERITVLNQVPSVFRSLVRMHAAADGGELALRYVVFGGESVDLDVAADFAQRLGPAAPMLVNMYGITETTVHATIKVLTQDELVRRSGSPIGRPLPHLEISIRDERLLPVPDGEPGEMFITGGGVAAGYLNRPELTAERFVTLDAPGGPRRYYRSGDLGMRTASGELEYLGRNDQQVKVRGFRIELGEIETVLREHEAVRDAAVLCQRSGPRQILVACVVALEPADQAEHRADLEARLRRHMAARLPEHMVPTRFRFEEQLPLTASGKLDRRALADRAAARAGAAT